MELSEYTGWLYFHLGKETEKPKYIHTVSSWFFLARSMDGEATINTFILLPNMWKNVLVFPLFG